MEFKDDLGKSWRYEDEGLAVTRSCVWSPPGCHPVGCGVKFYADAEGKLAKVEGDENQPVTKGRLCPRCLTLKDYVNHPDRIKYPMKHDPKYRGQADKWERISWEETFDLIESEWKRITDKYGPPPWSSGPARVARAAPSCRTPRPSRASTSGTACGPFPSPTASRRCSAW